jgi:hypothetical protein
MEKTFKNSGGPTFSQRGERQVKVITSEQKLPKVPFNIGGENER